MVEISDPKRKSGISKLNEVAEALRESEERYRRLVETAPLVIYNLSAEDGTITLLNPAFERITGWSLAEWLGKPFMPLVHPDDLTLAMETFQRVSRGEATPPYELRILSKSGEYLVGEFTSFPHIEKGKVIGEYGIARDITERKKAQAELREREEFNFALFEYNPVETIVVDLEGKVIKSNLAKRKSGDRLPHIGDTMYKDYAGKHEIDMYAELMKCIGSGGKKEFPEQKYGDRVLAITIAPFPKGAVIISEDITERKRAEMELRESQKRFQALTEATSDFVWETDANDVYTYCSPQINDLWGYMPEDMIGKTPFDFMIPEDRELAIKMFRTMSESPSSFKGMETRSRDNTGRIVVLETSGVAFFDRDGRLRGYRGISRDITERKKTEEAVRKSEEKYRSLTENVNLGIYRNTFGPKGKFIEANPAIIEMFGYESKEEFLAINVSDLYQNREDRNTFNNKILKEGFVRGEELRLKKKDGSLLVGSVSAVAVKDEQGRVKYFDGIIENINERKKMQKALQESETRFRIASKSTTDVIWEWDIDTDRLDWFGDIDGLLGYAPGEFPRTFEAWERLIDPEDHERVMTALGHHLAAGDRYAQEYRIRKKSGDIAYWEDRGIAICGARGKAIRMIGSITDVTERKRAEEEIWKKNAELEAFVHMVSHDLKNPVVSIQGFCSLLMKNYKDDLNKKALFYIQRMQANAGLMTNLLEDLVELSRIGRIEDKKSEVSVQEVIKSVWAGASASLAVQNVEFVFPENLPQIFYSEKRLYQIFYNLLSNALKFRDEVRMPKVEVGHREDMDHDTFFVRDNGIGIEPKYHDKIFESFSQLKDIKSEGTGMGLAIVKKIVEANQGKVWVESRKGGGSTFYFTVPKNVKS